MLHEIIEIARRVCGILSGVVVAISAFPYMRSIWNREIVPNRTTWTLWSIIGFSLLVTYQGSGALWNIGPAVMGAINPVIIIALIWWRGGVREPLTKQEKFCAVLSLASLATWWHHRSDHHLMVYVLCLSIIADICAAYPAFFAAIKKPADDKPGMWLIFAIGQTIAFGSISDWKFSNWILPSYMTTMSVAVAIPLVIYCLKNKIPLKQWV